jgi:hypothetical protein
MEFGLITLVWLLPTPESRQACSPESTRIYCLRVNRVIDHIKDHLTELRERTKSGQLFRALSSKVREDASLARSAAEGHFTGPCQAVTHAEA